MLPKFERARAGLAEHGVPAFLFLAEGRTHVSEFTSLGSPDDPLTEAIARFVRERSAAEPARPASRPESSPSRPEAPRRQVRALRSGESSASRSVAGTSAG
jgi:hypothetical protein